MSKALTRFFYTYFPSGLWKGTPPATKVKHHLSRSPVALRQCHVATLAKYLKHLVVMGIDKCRNTKLFLCPVLFEKLYSATFPVASDTVHFDCID